MLQPKRTKFRKMHKGRIHGEAKGGFLINFGSYALKATEPERVTARQIEAARRAITRHMKRQGRVWIRISRTSRSRPSPSKFVWVRARGPRTTGRPRSNPAGSCSRSTA